MVFAHLSWLIKNKLKLNVLASSFPLSPMSSLSIITFRQNVIDMLTDKKSQ